MRAKYHRGIPGLLNVIRPHSNATTGRQITNLHLVNLRVPGRRHLPWINSVIDHSVPVHGNIVVHRRPVPNLPRFLIPHSMTIQTMIGEMIHRHEGITV
jgi:hypothetical protein